MTETMMTCEKLYKNQFLKQVWLVDLDGGPGQVNDVSIEDLTVHLQHGKRVFVGET